MFGFIDVIKREFCFWFEENVSIFLRFMIKKEVRVRVMVKEEVKMKV